MSRPRRTPPMRGGVTVLTGATRSPRRTGRTAGRRPCVATDERQRRLADSGQRSRLIRQWGTERVTSWWHPPAAASAGTVPRVPPGAAEARPSTTHPHHLAGLHHLAGRTTSPNALPRRPGDASRPHLAAPAPRTHHLAGPGTPAGHTWPLPHPERTTSPSLRATPPHRSGAARHDGLGPDAPAVSARSGASFAGSRGARAGSRSCGTPASTHRRSSTRCAPTATS
jgi:hypothetical protein